MTNKLAEVIYEEYGLSISLAVAKRLAAVGEAHAIANGWKVVIVILDNTGSPVLTVKMDQTQLGSYDVAVEKAKTAFLFRRATIQFEKAVAEGAHRLLSMRNLIALQGGYPISEDDKVIGAIGVSGATGAQDSEVCEVALASLSADRQRE